MRAFVSRPLFVAAVGVVLLPAAVFPAQPAAAASLSSGSSALSSLSSGSDGSVDRGILVDVPGHGPYRISSDLTGTALDPAGVTQEDLLSAAVFSADYEGDAAVRGAALVALPPPRQAEVSATLAALHSEVPEPSTVSAAAPIVVLGNGLDPDGSVHPNLANRLAAAAHLAHEPERSASPVVVSGGPTADGHVEAHAMRDWLIGHGVAPGRIIVEERSYSTVTNARFTRELLPAAEEVLVVSSRDHIHRAVVDFTLAFGPDAAVAGVGAENSPPSPAPGTLGIYRDVLQWYLG